MQFYKQVKLLLSVINFSGKKPFLIRHPKVQHRTLYAAALRSDLSAVFRRLGEKLAVTYATPESVELGSINFVQVLQLNCLIFSERNLTHTHTHTAVYFGCFPLTQERQAAALWAANLRTVKDVSQASVSQISQVLCVPRRNSVFFLKKKTNTLGRCGIRL